MGGPTSRKKRGRVKIKDYKKGHSTKNRNRDVDQIQDDLKLEAQQKKSMSFNLDPDLPGMGLFYCTPCARHFIDAKVRDIHLRSKPHKRRLKDVKQKKYTQKEAELGAGKSIEEYTSAHSAVDSDAMLDT